jgi:hypothetical protein
VTLLLFNSLANEALPIFLAELVPGYVAVALSVTMILVFGEIIPSAVFTGATKVENGFLTCLYPKQSLSPQGCLTLTLTLSLTLTRTVQTPFHGLT